MFSDPFEVIFHVKLIWNTFGQHLLTNITLRTLKNAKILKKSHLAVCSIQNSFNRTSANIGDMDKLQIHVLLELKWTLTRDNFCLHLVNTCWLKTFYNIKCNEKINFQFILRVTIFNSYYDKFVILFWKDHFSIFWSFHYTSCYRNFLVNKSIDQMKTKIISC